MTSKFVFRVRGREVDLVGDDKLLATTVGATDDYQGTEDAVDVITFLRDAVTHFLKTRDGCEHWEWMKEFCKLPEAVDGKAE